MKEIKESKIRIKKNKNKSKFDTLSITRELEKSLSIDDELEKEKERIREKKKKLLKKRVLTVFGVLVLCISISFIYWLHTPYKTNPSVNEFLNGSDKVSVVTEKNGNLVFRPKENMKKTGIILYPGQKMEPRAYSRLSTYLANSGYEVVVTKLTMNTPIFSKNVADNVIKEHKDIKNWVLIAHSTSGDNALKESANQKNIIGVVFLGSYPSGDDLKLINKPVLTIWGTKDGLLDFTKFNDYKANLPANSSFYEIVGGNNTDFADVALVNGDNKALIQPSEQKILTANKVVEFIEGISSNNTLDSVEDSMNSKGDENANGVVNSENNN